MRQQDVRRNSTVALKDAENLASSDTVDLGNTVRIPQDHTNLGRSQTLLCELANVLLNLGGRDLQPRWGAPLVRQSRWGHTLPVSKCPRNRYQPKTIADTEYMTINIQSIILTPNLYWLITNRDTTWREMLVTLEKTRWKPRQGPLTHSFRHEIRR
jgi:hypothetical protein